MAQPGGTFTYVFDPDGRISNLTNPEVQVTSWSYDAASRNTRQAMANGVTVSYTYDSADRLLVLANLGAGTTLSSFAYSYDSVGNRTQVVEADGSAVTWSYDRTSQLTNENRTGTASYNITYAYDPVGNRTLMVNDGALTTQTYNAANELSTSQTSSGVTTYTFDGDGNLLSGLVLGSQRTTNTWDAENRLTNVALPSGTVDTFTYNGDGQRVQKQDSGGTTNHVWDMQNISLETNSSGTTLAAYTLSPDTFGSLLSQNRGGVTSFYLCDALGSARQLANQSGTVTDSYVYDSFGNLVASSGTTSNPFRYVGRTGYYWDADLASRYFARARYLDSSRGLFLSRDPRGWPKPWLFYAYCLNNPSILTDPSGLDAITIPLPTGGQARVDCDVPRRGGKPGPPCVYGDIIPQDELEPMLCGVQFDQDPECDELELIRTFPLISDTLNTILRECGGIPPITCALCPPPCDFFDGATFNVGELGAIVLCIDKSPTQLDLQYTLYHELVHVWAACTNLIQSNKLPVLLRTPLTACESSLLNEAIAYFCEGDCKTPNQCFIEALRSVCPLGTCSLGELQAGIPQQAFLNWWWSVPTAQKCPKELPPIFPVL